MRVLWFEDAEAFEVIDFTLIEKNQFSFTMGNIVNAVNTESFRGWCFKLLTPTNVFDGNPKRTLEIYDNEKPSLTLLNCLITNIFFDLEEGFSMKGSYEFIGTTVCELN